MKRRAFISLLSGAVAWPVLAQAQQPAIPVIGLLHGATHSQFTDVPFRQGLREAGFIEGQNVVIESRWASDVCYNSSPCLSFYTEAVIIRSLPKFPLFSVKSRHRESRPNPM